MWKGVGGIESSKLFSPELERAASEFINPASGLIPARQAPGAKAASRILARCNTPL